jgi:LacI family transcriptional regulator
LSIRDVAKRAGVSIATVSRTINGRASVTPHLARRVWRAIDELDFYLDTQARGLVSGRSRTFGLIISDITNPFFPEVVQGFEDLAVQNDYEILTSSTLNDPRRMALSVRRMIERKVDGVAVVTFGMEGRLLNDLKSRRVPLVFIDVGPALPRVSNIRIDYLHGIRQAIQHLAALCHKRIAFISGPLTSRSALARLEAFSQAMTEIGLRVIESWVVEGNHTVEGGMSAAQKILALPERPTAVLCSNDITAIGVMRESFRQGVRIPQDLSVIGFDDIRIAQFTIPPLTSVRMSQTEIAELAFTALLVEVQRENASPNGSEYLLRTNLVLRESTSMPGKVRKTAASEMLVAVRRPAHRTKLQRVNEGC